MSIITRFAPSPTGVLHTGSARTALFNYLFSKHNKGKFLLRIEDTDKERSKNEHIKAIIGDLAWLGYQIDGDVVYQSKRLDRHAEVAQEMVKLGKAYYCYSSLEEIEQFRLDHPHQKFVSPWRNNALKVPPADAKPVIRLKVDHDGKTIIKDLIQGEITVENTELDDMVMLRSDGSPTYMLAVVVDDFDMNISHIIRGDDHLTNAFRQKQIYEAMGWKIPEFAHLPLILDKDGKKLSKRAGALGIEEYKKLGYLPEAVNNHLLRLGFGHGNDEIIPMPDAINIFTLNGVGKSSAKFDIEKLNFINAHYMRLKTDKELFEMVEPNLVDKSTVILERVKKGIAGLKTRTHTLVELADLAKIYIAKITDLDDKSKEVLTSFGFKLLPDLIALFSNVTEWNKDSIQNRCNEFATAKQLKASQIMQTLRVTVLGTLAGPSIYEVIEILGKEETIARMGHT